MEISNIFGKRGSLIFMQVLSVADKRSYLAWIQDILTWLAVKKSRIQLGCRQLEELQNQNVSYVIIVNS